MIAQPLQWLNELAKAMLFVVFFRHYYQPPRRFAWSPYNQKIVRQRSAYPYHDWTERVHCRGCSPATRARIIDMSNGRVHALLNTFDLAGDFDVGASYLDWLRRHDRKAYRRIIAADRRSAKHFTINNVAYPSAMVQAAHGHLILPLCNDADLETQVIWAVENFKFHFKRAPEAAWLPEGAVSKRVLQMLSRHGIKRTILRASQAKRFRKIGGSEKDWVNIGENGHHLDERRAYRVDLAPEADMVIVFSHDEVSKDIAFEPKQLAREAQGPHGMVAAMLHGLDSNGGEWRKIRVAAVDGETFGEHVEQGYMALAKAIEMFCHPDSKARLINTGAFVALAGVEYEVEVWENSSWSCIHGVDRWVRECGCGAEHDPGGHQRWRQPVRAAMDWLRDLAHAWFGSKEGGRRWFTDPWKARNGFIHVILQNGSEESLRTFAETYCHKGLSKKQIHEAEIACQIMYDLMSMYTSCGWFFGSMGLEMGQNFLFAYRAILQAKRFGLDWEGNFVAMLETAPCRYYGTAAALWNKELRPYAVQSEIDSLVDELVGWLDIDTIKRAKELADVTVNLSVDRHRLQDSLFKTYRRTRGRLQGEDEASKALMAEFVSLAEKLRIKGHVLEEDFLEREEIEALTADL
jgi:hypothetical protein